MVHKHASYSIVSIEVDDGTSSAQYNLHWNGRGEDCKKKKIYADILRLYGNCMTIQQVRNQ